MACLSNEDRLIIPLTPFSISSALAGAKNLPFRLTSSSIYRMQKYTYMDPITFFATIYKISVIIRAVVDILFT